MKTIIRSRARGDVLRVEGLANYLANKYNEEINVCTNHPEMINSYNSLVTASNTVKGEVILNLDGHENFNWGNPNATLEDRNYLGYLNKLVGERLPLPNFKFQPREKDKFILVCPEAAMRVWDGKIPLPLGWSHRIWPSGNFRKLISILSKDFEVKESCFAHNSLNIKNVECVSHWWSSIDNVLSYLSSASLIICNSSLVSVLGRIAKTPVLEIANTRTYLEGSFNLIGYNIEEHYITCKDFHSCPNLDSSKNQIAANQGLYQDCITSIPVDAVYDKAIQILNKQ